jgi:hypothetical protein
MLVITMRIESPYTIPRFVGVSPDLNQPSELSERAGGNNLFPAETFQNPSPYFCTPICIPILITYSVT